MRNLFLILLVMLVFEGMAQEFNLKRCYSFAKSSFGSDFINFRNLQLSPYPNRYV
jgi:hypothetical protein